MTHLALVWGCRTTYEALAPHIRKGQDMPGRCVRLSRQKGKTCLANAPATQHTRLSRQTGKTCLADAPEAQHTRLLRQVHGMPGRCLRHNTPGSCTKCMACQASCRTVPSAHSYANLVAQGKFGMVRALTHRESQAQHKQGQAPATRPKHKQGQAPVTRPRHKPQP